MGGLKGASRPFRYTGIDQANEAVKVYNLNYLTKNLKHGSKVLLVDDVFDTGHTIKAFVEKIRSKIDFDIEIRVATV